MTGFQYPSDLPDSTIRQMALAGAVAVDCIVELHRSGSNLVDALIRSAPEFVEWEHYPNDDVRDAQSGALYYFHAHPREGDDDSDCGHFHLFMRSDDAGSETRMADSFGWKSNDISMPSIYGNGSTHLIAISMTRAGMPTRLFTTSRWVTDETWQDAAATLALLDNFALHLNEPSRPLNRWLDAVGVLFRPQIAHLLFERDRVIRAWQAEYPHGDAFEDRRLEVPSFTDISLQDQILWLDRELDAAVRQSA